MLKRPFLIGDKAHGGPFLHEEGAAHQKAEHLFHP